MPRRMLDSRIFQNEKYGELPLGASQLLVSIVTHADEDGRLKGSAKFLRSITFPYSEEITTEQTEGWKNLLAATGLIRTYSKNGDQFVDIPGWEDPQSEFHQVLRKDRYTPSLLPSFDEGDNQLPPAGQPPDSHPTDTCPLEGKVSKGKVVPTSKEVGLTPGKKPVKQADADDAQKASVSTAGTREGDVDTPKKQTDEQKAKQSVISLVIQAVYDHYGYRKDGTGKTKINPVPFPGKEAKSISRMLQRGFTQQQIIDFWKKKVEARGAFVSFVYVNDDIGQPERRPGATGSVGAKTSQRDTGGKPDYEGSIKRFHEQHG